MLLSLLTMASMLAIEMSAASAQTGPPAADTFAQAVAVTIVPATLTGTIEAATDEAGEPQDCDGLTSTVWYKLQLSEETPIEVTLQGEGVSLAVYTGSDISSVQRHDCMGWGNAGYERAGFWALPNKLYYVQVGTTGSATVPDFTLDISRFDEPEPYPDSKPPCDSKAYKLFVEYNNGPRRTVWYLNAGSVPDYLNVGEVKRAIREAIKNISESRNDCGLDDRVAIRTRLDGAKGAKASSCYGNSDKLHMIEFTGKLPNAGRSCGSINSEDDADVWMRSEKDLFTTDPLTTLCRQGIGGRVDLESMLTHELGHAFGLDHPNGDSANLTLYFATRTCNSSQRTLGLGDVLGLRRLY